MYRGSETAKSLPACKAVPNLVSTRDGVLQRLLWQHNSKRNDCTSFSFEKAKNRIRLIARLDIFLCATISLESVRKLYKNTQRERFPRRNIFCLSYASHACLPVGRKAAKKISSGKKIGF